MHSNQTNDTRAARKKKLKWAKQKRFINMKYFRSDKKRSAWVQKIAWTWVQPTFLTMAKTKQRTHKLQVYNGFDKKSGKFIGWKNYDCIYIPKKWTPKNRSRGAWLYCKNIICLLLKRWWWWWRRRRRGSDQIFFFIISLRFI